MRQALRITTLAITLAVLSLAGAGHATVVVQDQAEIAPGIPRLVRTASSAEGFAPEGWRVEQAVQGDFSRDGKADLAFVLRKTDPVGIITREYFDPTDINPRIIGVALGSRPGGGFTLAAQDHRLIPTRDAEGLNLEDPFEQGLAISNGSLVVQVYLFMSAGGGDAGPYSFRLRYQDGAVRLIGYDHVNVQRMSGATRTISVNFLTGRMTTATGSIETDKETTVVSRTTTPPLTLDQIGDAFAFEHDVLNPPAE
ncbi:hypothetical protein [Brevundimonas sp.]|uniref:hypothetical protein n=1 Tax=Brevundimonas sp. TaxID=1871086 RepID=UPI003BAAD6F8